MQELLLMLGGGCLGGFVGYVIAIERSRTQRRVQQELWDRKFHMCDTDRAQAMADLNQNQLATEGMRSKHVGLLAKAQELEGIAGRADTVHMAMEKAITARDEKIQQLSQTAASLKKEHAVASQESRRKTEVYREVSAERDELQATVEQKLASTLAAEAERDNLMELLETERQTQRKELAIAKNKMGTQEEQLAVLTVQCESLGSAESQRQTLAKQVQQLEPLPRKLQTVSAQLDAVQRERDEARIRASSSEGKWLKLEPLPAKLDQRESELRSLKQSVTQERTAVAERVANLEDQIEELEPLGARLLNREREVESLSGRLAQAEAQAAEETSALTEEVEKLRPVPAMLSAREATLNRTRSELKDLQEEHRSSTANSKH